MKIAVKVFLIGASSLFQTMALSQTSYTLACRPGPGLQIYQRQTTGGLHVFFRRGQTAAVNGLEAGTCAWLDRGVSVNEPNTTCHSAVNDVHWAFNSGSNQLTSMYSRTGQAPYLEEAFKGQVFYLKVYNDAGRCMNVTGFGL